MDQSGHRAESWLGWFGLVRPPALVLGRANQPTISTSSALHPSSPLLHREGEGRQATAEGRGSQFASAGATWKRPRRRRHSCSSAPGRLGNAAVVARNFFGTDRNNTAAAATNFIRGTARLGHTTRAHPQDRHRGPVLAGHAAVQQPKGRPCLNTSPSISPTSPDAPRPYTSTPTALCGWITRRWPTARGCSPSGCETPVPLHAQLPRIRTRRSHRPRGRHHVRAPDAGRPRAVRGRLAARRQQGVPRLSRPCGKAARPA
jgi:hypothetical protein